MTLDQLVADIRRLSAHYQPNQKVADHLKNTVMIPLIGPAAVGKTSAVHNAEENDDRFGVVRSFTTRPKRPDDPPDNFRFKPHTVASLQNILDELKAGDLVQVTVHPTNGFIYGSETIDYSRPFSMLETLSTAMAELEGIPFGGLRPLALVSPPDVWWPRFNERFAEEVPEENSKRLREAVISLDWLLNQGQDFPWVVNDGSMDQMTDTIIGLATQELQPILANRQIGSDLLASIKARL